MDAIAENESRESPSARHYFVLSYCLLVPTAGTFMFFVSIDHINNDALGFLIASGVYLSSVVLGVLNMARFKKLTERENYWALVVGIILSSVCALLAIGACIFSFAGPPYIC